MDEINPVNPSVPPPVRPKNWLVESILVTIFCCLPFGIVGIIYAAGVNAKYDSGQYAEALESSRQAGKWTKIGLFTGIAIGVIYAILALIFGVSVFNASDFNS
ncbi:MAG TPA: CD225/dispanin family protein [Anseongella sp.]|nr:CD225/dispanin family protein [Anseongella sp.]